MVLFIRSSCNTMLQWYLVHIVLSTRSLWYELHQHYEYLRGSWIIVFAMQYIIWYHRQCTIHTETWKQLDIGSKLYILKHGSSWMQVVNWRGKYVLHVYQIPMTYILLRSLVVMYYYPCICVYVCIHIVYTYSQGINNNTSKHRNTNISSLSSIFS